MPVKPVEDAVDGDLPLINNPSIQDLLVLIFYD